MGKGKKRQKEKDDPQALEVFELFSGDEEALTPEGLQLALGALGMDVTEATCEALFERHRDMGQATFLKLAKTLPKVRDDAEEAFDLFDEDGKGYIVREDLVRIANELQEQFSDADFEGMLRLAEDDSGLVTKEAFVSFYNVHLSK